MGQREEMEQSRSDWQSGEVDKMVRYAEEVKKEGLRDGKEVLQLAYLKRITETLEAILVEMRHGRPGPNYYGGHEK